MRPIRGMVLSSAAIVTALCHAAPVDCTAQQLAVAKSATVEATKALQKAASAIQSGDKGAAERLDRWMGVKNSAQADAVRTRIVAVSTWLNGATFRCENTTSIALGDVYAYVDPKLGLVITLGAFFFQAPQNGALSSQLGVLVHEASHFAIAGAAKDPKIYGPAEALILAKNSPTEAQSNAENFEYFVESFYFGLTP